MWLMGSRMSYRSGRINTSNGFYRFLDQLGLGRKQLQANLGIHTGEYMYFSCRYMAVRLRYSFK